MEWIDKHKLISLIVAICIIVGSDILCNKIYLITSVSKMDEKTYLRSKRYTDSVYVSGQDSMIFYVKEIHKILDNGRANKNLNKTSE